MKLLLYCTKAKKQKDLLWSNNLKHFFLDGAYNRLIDNLPDYLLNGKIVAECDFEVEEIRIVDDDPLGAYWYETKTLSENEVLEKSCLTSDELFEYLGEDNEGYAIHIKNLHIFDKPKELEYCFTEKSYKIIDKIFTDEIMIDGKWYRPVNKAPQNMMRVKRVLKEDGILISIRPEWLCKILNGEKTIEVRKKVLKEMLR